MNKLIFGFSILILGTSVSANFINGGSENNDEAWSISVQDVSFSHCKVIISNDAVSESESIVLSLSVVHMSGLVPVAQLSQASVLEISHEVDVVELVGEKLISFFKEVDEDDFLISWLYDKEAFVAVTEPGSFLLIVMGLLGVAGSRRRSGYSV